MLALGAIFYVATNKDSTPDSLDIENKIGAAHEDKADEAAQEFVKRYIKPAPFPAPAKLTEPDFTTLDEDE